MDELDEIMARIRLGSEAALKQLMGGWAHVLEELAYRLLFDRGEAADVVQETFVTLWTRRESYRSDQPAWPWIIRILRNKCCDRWRQQGSRRRDGVPVEESIDCVGYVCCPGLSADRTYENRDLAEVAKKRVELLPARLREVVQLALFSDMTDAEVARTLGVPLGTVKSRKHRGLAQLRREVDSPVEDVEILNSRQRSRGDNIQ